MRITFLGTSHGRMQKDRHCSSTLIETQNKKYLVDAGAPVSDILTSMEIPFKSIDAVFITHLHGDHVNGLIDFCDLLTWAYVIADPLIFFPEKDASQALESWLSLLHGDQLPRRLRYGLVTEGVFFDDGIVSVEGIPNRHLEKNNNRPSYSFLIKAEGKRIVLTGDLLPDLSDFPYAAFDEKNDLVVCEGAHNHVLQHIDIFERCNTKMIGLTHVNPARNPDVDIEKFKQSMRIPVKHFSDGDTVEI